MAKRRNGVNKSQAIRDLYASSPKLPVKQAVDTLGKKGIKVAPSQIYFVLGGVRGKAKRKKRQHAAAMDAVVKSKVAFPIEVIRELRGLAGKVGGMVNIKRLVDVLVE